MSGLDICRCENNCKVNRDFELKFPSGEVYKASDYKFSEEYKETVLKTIENVLKYYSPSLLEKFKSKSTDRLDYLCLFFIDEVLSECSSYKKKVLMYCIFLLLKLISQYACKEHIVDVYLDKLTTFHGDDSVSYTEVFKPILYIPPIESILSRDILEKCLWKDFNTNKVPIVELKQVELKPVEKTVEHTHTHVHIHVDPKTKVKTEVKTIVITRTIS
jgi:hypothetical protein